MLVVRMTLLVLAIASSALISGIPADSSQAQECPGGQCPPK